MIRPKCWSFAMAFLGDPEQAQVEQYVKELEAELDRLRAELAAEKQANKELQLVIESHLRSVGRAEVSEVEPLKALLREVYSILPDDLNARIRAALGDEPADDPAHKQP